MMVYVPEHRLLYGSDAFQRSADGGFSTTQTVSEVVQAAERKKIAVDEVFMMHIEAIPRGALKAALAAAITGKAPVKRQ